jgi:putative membrane protein
MRNIIGLVVFLVCFSVGATFYGLNSARVDLNFYFGTVEQIPVVWALFLAMVFGIFVMFLVSMGVVIALRREIRKLRKQKQTIELELKNLRTLPLRDE